MTDNASQAKPSISAQLAQLPELSMTDLWSLWDELFAKRPGNHHRTYLESRIAYRLQERACGGLSPVLRRALEKIGQTGVVPNRKRGLYPQLTPGTVLMREFKEIMYRVTVMSDGRFEFEGRPYRSLSGIAKAITGATWNGPVFFGVKPRPKDKPSGAKA